MKMQKKCEIKLSMDECNEEPGLGRKRTEMQPDPHAVEYKSFSLQILSEEEQKIFDELGLGRNALSGETVLRPTNSRLVAQQ
jgi:hypothetical protein